MWAIVTDVCLLVPTVSHRKTAAPIKMPFGRQTRVRKRNQVLDGARDPPKKGTLGGLVLDDS